jgi:hypothetical protein
MLSGFIKKRDFMPQMAQLNFNLTESNKLAEEVFTIEVLSEEGRKIPQVYPLLQRGIVIRHVVYYPFINL